MAESASLTISESAASFCWTSFGFSLVRLVKELECGHVTKTSWSEICEQASQAETGRVDWLAGWEEHALRPPLDETFNICSLLLLRRA